ncbi:hypothetical protein F5Y11DRAFT_351482 [Daldinia sp. FL1419]|nr:hypothetical protein F5Y11DRAFT_351482 [Daldinia sp. FL1419]
MMDLPLGLLNAAQGHPMLVELKNGETLNGHLIQCDTWMNLTLKEVIQTSPEGDKFVRLPEVYIKGNNTRSSTSRRNNTTDNKVDSGAVAVDTASREEITAGEAVTEAAAVDEVKGGVGAEAEEREDKSALDQQQYEDVNHASEKPAELGHSARIPQIR